MISERPGCKSGSVRSSGPRSTAQWDEARGRIAILGPAGYGKTVAALTLLKRINTIEAADAPLAELFQLSEWYRWQDEHPGGVPEQLACRPARREISGDPWDDCPGPC